MNVCGSKTAEVKREFIRGLLPSEIVTATKPGQGGEPTERMFE